MVARVNQEGGEHPLLPVRGEPCRSISLRVEDPRETATALTGVPLRLPAEAPGLLDGPGADHVGAFRRSVSGSRASVLLHLGPSGPVRVVHKGRAPFGVDLLSAGTAPEQELVRASGTYRDVLELRIGAVLQISGGPGRWSFESVLR